MTEGTDYIDRVLNNLIYLQRSSEEEVEVFAELMHNDDLCPQLDLQVDHAISLFERFQKVVYDMQGMRDRGLDVTVRYGLEDDESEMPRLVGFQVKSASDLAQDEWLTKLKSQCWEAMARAGLTRLYVFVCTPVRTAQQRDKVRMINAELAEHPRTIVVSPQYAHGFLYLSERRMGAYLKRYFSKDDIVYRTAVDSVANLSPGQTALALQALALAAQGSNPREFARSDLLESLILHEIYSGFPDLPHDFFLGEDEEQNDYEWTERGRPIRERIQEDIESLEGRYLRSSIRTDEVMFLDEGLDALKALVFDGSVRYGYSGKELMEYALATVKSEALDRISDWKEVTVD